MNHITQEDALSAGVPKRYIPGKPFSDMHFTHDQSSRSITGYYDTIPLSVTRDKTNLFLFGVSGTGKSEVCSILAKKTLSFGLNSAMFRIQDFIEARSRNIPDGQHSLYSWVISLDLFILDQIEQARYFPDTLNAAMEYRWNNEKPTVLSMGIQNRWKTRENVKNVYEAALEEVLQKMEKPMGMSWPSRVFGSFDKVFTGYTMWRKPVRKAIKVEEPTPQIEADDDEG